MCSSQYLVMSRRSFPLLDLESRVTESVVERSVGVRVVSISEISMFLFSNSALLVMARDIRFIVM